MDRTKEAIKRQITAMGVSQFEVGIRDAESGRMQQREWDAAKIMESIGWLKRQNARGNDIYIRPAEANPGLVLVDDLSAEGIASMRKAGHEPAAVTETSPQNFQAWVRVPKEATNAERSAIGRRLAKSYDADPNSADHRHYGRLAGFTNRKPQYSDKRGYQPFVILRESTGRAASNAKGLLEQAREDVRARAQRQQEAVKPIAVRDGDARNEYRAQIAALQDRVEDHSRRDFIVAMNLARKGWSARSIEAAMSSESPELETRKAGHIEDYVRRTVDKALQAAQAPRVRPEQGIGAPNQNYDERAHELQKVWEKLAPAKADHPILVRKKVQPYGLRQSKAGALVVPLRDVNGKLWSLQKISPDGQKTLHNGARKAGCFHLIGKQPSAGNAEVFICEGYATGASIHEATGKTVAVAFDAGNLKAVARSIRKHLGIGPHLFIMANNDHGGKDNVGVTKAKEAARESLGVPMIPSIDRRHESRESTTWNDMHRTMGLAEVRATLDVRFEFEETYEKQRPREKFFEEGEMGRLVPVKDELDVPSEHTKKKIEDHLRRTAQAPQSPRARPEQATAAATVRDWNRPENPHRKRTPKQFIDAFNRVAEMAKSPSQTPERAACLREQLNKLAPYYKEARDIREAELAKAGAEFKQAKSRDRGLGR